MKNVFKVIALQKIHYVNRTLDRHFGETHRRSVGVLSIGMGLDVQLNTMFVFPIPVKTMVRVSLTINLIDLFVFVRKNISDLDVKRKDLQFIFLSLPTFSIAVLFFKSGRSIFRLSN
jgi:hypothetical protein